MTGYQKEIKSLQHPLVKYCVKLRKERKYRFKEKRVVLEGKKMISEHPYQLETLFLIDDLLPHLTKPPKNCYIVSKQIIEKMSGALNPEPYVAIASLPKFSSLKQARCLLVLDRLSDPGNMGTLIRTAFSLGFDGAFLIQPSVDPFSDKSLRSAKGTTFLLPLRMGTDQECIQLIKDNQLFCYLADPKGTSSISFSFPLALILGNESHGISHSLKSCGTSLAIPMSADSHSLNVAVAGGILMHHIQGQFWID